ncbi:MAG: STAS domain-containing protein [Planctomycetota bacterium]|jgi:anti-anti-sigma regulatory factor
MYIPADPVDEIKALEPAGLGFVKLKQHLSTTNEIPLDNHLKRAVRDGFGKYIVLDCSETKAVGSAMGMLVYWADRLETDGGGLLLANPHKNLDMVMTMLGLSSFFTVFDTVDDAIAFAVRRLNV